MEPAAEARDALQGRALPKETPWDVNAPELVAKHLAATRGSIRTRFPPEPNGCAFCIVATNGRAQMRTLATASRAT